jgi:hypothetical protein
MIDPCRAAQAVAEDDYEALLRRVIFACDKWHVVNGDTRVLCPFPLVLSATTWRHLARAAEGLAREALAAELELGTRPELLPRLGLPRALLAPLRRLARRPPAPGLARVARFDFHPTPDGFRVSEGNVDAAGGFIEASGVTAQLAEHFPALLPTGDPAAAYADAVHAAIGAEGRVGFLHVTSYTEDRQVMAYLARRLAERDVRAQMFGPAQLCFAGGRAAAATLGGQVELDAIFRFVPAEWLPRHPRDNGWSQLFVDGLTPTTNPGYAVLTQSKRFPALRDELNTPLPTWDALVPPARDPREVDWYRNETWVLKPALAHEGDRIGIWGVTEATLYERLAAAARARPDEWVVQRRFVAASIDTPDGAAFPCIGVYVVDGQAAGAYGRLAARPLIDIVAREIAVLVAED